MGARLRQLREGPWRSADELEGAAVARLRELLPHASAHMPFYRRRLGDAGVRPETARNLDALSRVPVATRAALEAAGLEATTAETLEAARRWRMMSSGSAGMPFTCHADLRAEDARIASFMRAFHGRIRGGI